MESGSITKNILEWLAELSAKLGSGNTVSDVLIVLIVLTIVALALGIVSFLRGSQDTELPVGFERVSSIGGRVERIEKNANESRTEILRSFESLKAEVAALRVQLRSLRDEVRGIHRSGSDPEDEEFLIPRGATSDEKLAPVSASSITRIEDLPRSEQQEGEDVLSDSSTASAEGVSPKGVVPDLSLDSTDLTPADAGEGSAEDSAGEPVEKTWQEQLAARQERTESLTTRLAKTRQGFFARLKSVFVRKPTLDAETLGEVEAILVSADIGIKTAQSLLEDIKAELSAGQAVNESAVISMLKVKLLQILEVGDTGEPLRYPKRTSSGPRVVMVVGVNGVGKTTTTAKLAHVWKSQGSKVLLVAADTFRAAAVEQLKEWGSRVDVRVFAGIPDAKPQTVVFDAMKVAQEEEYDVVLIDTAGRLHTKSNLMQELEGVKATLERQQSGAPHETLLVLDGSTGQNALNQAREFNESLRLSGLIVTKLDGTPRGGVVVAIKNELGVPIRYIGVGESKNDLRPFVARDFVEALFDARADGGADGNSTSGADTGGSEALSAHGETRRRKRRETQPYIPPIGES